MSIDTELWTREAGKLADVLPRASEWQYFDDGEAQIVVGDGLLSIGEPEEDTSGMPPDVAAIASGQRFYIGITLESASAGPEATEFLGHLVEAVGRAWGGVGRHPLTGRTVSW